jgi:hypothetical protein
VCIVHRFFFLTPAGAKRKSRLKRSESGKH